MRAILGRHGIDDDPDHVLALLDTALEEARPAPSRRPDRRRAALLARGGFDVRQQRQDDYDPVLQAALDYTSLRETSLGTTDVTARLGLSDSRVRQLVGEGRLAILPGRPRRFPAWQFADGGLVPHLQEVLPRAPKETSPVELWQFFIRANPDLILGGETVSPREWLLGGGDPGEVTGLLAEL